MDLKEELQPFFKFLSALIFTATGVAGLFRQEVGRYGQVWFSGTSAVIFWCAVLAVGLALLVSWIRDRGWAWPRS